MIPHARSPKVLVRDFDEIVNRFGTTKLSLEYIYFYTSL